MGTNHGGTASSTGIAAVDAGCLFVSNNAQTELAKKLDSRAIADSLQEVHAAQFLPLPLPSTRYAPGLPWR